jgi:hypothetical protein
MCLKKRMLTRHKENKRTVGEREMEHWVKEEGENRKRGNVGTEKTDEEKGKARRKSLR